MCGIVAAGLSLSFKFWIHLLLANVLMVNNDDQNVFSFGNGGCKNSNTCIRHTYTDLIQDKLRISPENMQYTCHPLDLSKQKQNKNNNKNLIKNTHEVKREEQTKESKLLHADLLLPSRITSGPE